MVRICLLFLLFTLPSLADEYPKLFAQLGTPLYQANDIFRDLSNFEQINDKATEYHILVIKLRSLASSIEDNPYATKKEKQEYFKGLRDLQNKYDELLRIIDIYLLKSIDTNNYKEFARIMNSGIDTFLQNSVIRKRTMAYYVAYRTRGKIPKLELSYQTLTSDPELMEYVKGHMPKTHLMETSYSSGGVSHKVLLSNNEQFAYVANGDYCFKTIEITDFENASEISGFDFHGEECSLVDISLSSTGEFLYLSDEKNGFSILDVTQPDSPVQKGEYSRLRAFSSLPSADDNRSFVIRKTKGLSIFDISDKDDFKLLANYNRGLHINHLALDENRSRLYLSHDKGVSILDISHIGNPREISKYPIKEGANYITLSPKKDIAYVASGENGIHVLDLSNDQNASLISTCLTPKYAKHLTLSSNGERLYVSALEDGVYYIDAKDPKELKHISTYRLKDSNASALSSTLNQGEDTLFISFSTNGISKIKIQDE